MATSATFGEKDWEEESASGGGKSDFFNMKDDGQYHMRLVGKPHEFAAHWVEAGGSKRKVNCAGKDCVLCKKKVKANVRYLIPIIIRRGPGVGESDQNAVKVTEFGPQVYGHIRSLFKTPDWGNPTGYDIMVDKNKGRGASGTYFVTPTKRIALSDEEKAEVAEFLGRMDLKELSAPLSNELIIEKLGPEISAALGLSLSRVAAADPATEFNFEEENASEYTFEN